MGGSITSPHVRVNLRLPWMSRLLYYERIFSAFGVLYRLSEAAILSDPDPPCKSSSGGLWGPSTAVTAHGNSAPEPPPPCGDPLEVFALSRPRTGDALQFGPTTTLGEKRVETLTNKRSPHLSNPNQAPPRRPHIVCRALGAPSCAGLVGCSTRGSTPPPERHVRRHGLSKRGNWPPRVLSDLAADFHRGSG